MAGGRRGDAGERRRGHAARARERVCVRLINQTFAFGILAREKEEELEIAEEEVATGARGRTKRRTRRRRYRPGRVEHEARTGQRTVPFQEPSSEFHVSLFVPRFFLLLVSHSLAVSLR